MARSAADPHIDAGSVLDGGRRDTGRACGHGFGVGRRDPRAPVWPPGPGIFGGAFHPFLDRLGIRAAASPVLVLAGGGWIDHAGDMARTAQHDAHLTAEELRAVL